MLYFFCQFQFNHEISYVAIMKGPIIDNHRCRLKGDFSIFNNQDRYINNLGEISIVLKVSDCWIHYKSNIESFVSFTKLLRRVISVYFFLRITLYTTLKCHHPYFIFISPHKIESNQLQDLCVHFQTFFHFSYLVLKENYMHEVVIVVL